MPPISTFKSFNLTGDDKTEGGNEGEPEKPKREDPDFEEPEQAEDDEVDGESVEYEPTEYADLPFRVDTPPSEFGWGKTAEERAKEEEEARAWIASEKRESEEEPSE